MPKMLDYAPPAPHRRHRRVGWTLGIAGFALVLALLIPLPMWRVATSINPTTGTEVRQSSSGTVTVPSPLETRLRAAGIAWTARPQFLGATRYDITGRSCGAECGTAPPIYPLRPLLKAFADASTDGELRAFVRVMETGTDAEQRAAVDAACGKALAVAGNQPH